MAGLTKHEIMKIVLRYIGVSSGYLGDFNYRTHAEFYPLYCDLDIDPYQYQGTTRERFTYILESSPADIQAKIVRGVLERFTPDDENKPLTRTKELHDELVGIALRLEGASPIHSPEPKITSAAVERAIGDAEILIQTNGAISGVDRIHTALHGYLRAVCESETIQYNEDDSMARMFKLLRQKHPSLRNVGERPQDIERILLSLASILDALNPIRNKASIAHPNKELLEKDEAMLVINTARTLLHYLDAKFSDA